MGRLALVALVVVLGHVRAEAAAVCNCCVTALPAACEVPCKAVGIGQGQCPVFVEYSSKFEPGALNGMSYMGISLGEPSEAQLEGFRRTLERERRKARSAYRRAIAAYDAGGMPAEDFAAAKARFQEAMVNYNHAIHAYLVRIGRKSD
jgi:hypothetical protein